jgi:hypothetical protein
LAATYEPSSSYSSSDSDLFTESPSSELMGDDPVELRRDRVRGGCFRVE